MSSGEATIAEAEAEFDAFNERYEAAKKGKARLTKDDLRIVTMAAGGDAGIMLDIFPAEGVPEEIEDAWREMRSLLPLQKQISDFITGD